MSRKMEDIRVGDPVLVNKKYKAVVKFVGPTSFKAGIWYGVELEKPKGKHNGTVYGVTYFVAKMNHGTFVSRDDLSLYDEKEEAASAVSDALRSNLDRKRAEREAYQRASVTLDADEESKHLLRRQMLSDTLLSATLNRERPEGAWVEGWEKEVDALVVERGYDGPHISFPLTLQQVLTMMEHFKAGRILHYKYAFQLLAEYRRYVGELPTLVEADVMPGTRLTVCGDTHGQLKDLFGIYTINGIPSATNRYLMNGDFVDRGEYSCEVMFTLMAFALLYPGEARTARGASCMLNRGNHEAHNQNMTQGFMSEVLEKYSTCAGSAHGLIENGLRMYDLFLLTFDAMPLAHVLRSSSGDKKVFVVHGGLMQAPGVRLAHIAALKRKKEIPYGYPGFEDKLYEDLMWSDPRPARGTAPNTRGAGVYFGPDITQRFCAGNGISLVVRSHECVQEGYQFMHEGRLVTVFSASHYCGRDTNRGAFITFDQDLTQTIQQYVAGSLAATAPALQPPSSGPLSSSGAGVIAAGTAKAATAIAPLVVLAGPDMDDATAAAQEESVRRMIAERVVLHKPDLYFFWACADNTGAKDGKITKLQWAEGMRVVLNLDLPWLTLAPSLAECDEDGRIQFAKFLDRYHITLREADSAWMDAIVERTSEKLFAACSSLEAAYAFFDTDASGSIDLEEFERGLTKINLGLSRAQVVDLMNSMDADKDGRIQLAEFVNRFRVTFSRIKDISAAGKAVLGSLDAWTRESLEKIGAAMFKGTFGSNPSAVFARIDSNNDGQLSAEEFTRVLKELKLEFTDEQTKKILDAVDVNKNGSLNYTEFVQAFRVTDSAYDTSVSGAGAIPSTSARPWQRGVVERIVATLFEYRLELASAFRLFDMNGDGIITKDEFRQGLRALTALTGSPITDMQADELMKALDKDGSGTIDFAEFVAAFQVTDSGSKPSFATTPRSEAGSKSSFFPAR